MHILKQVPSTCTLRRILKQAIFGKRVHCPHCGSRYIRTLKQEERWRCTQCQLPFSIKSSCWLKGSKLPLETIWLLLWCWQKKFTLQHAQEVVGVSYPTVSRWYQLFREHIPKERIEAMVGGQVVSAIFRNSSKSTLITSIFSLAPRDCSETFFNPLATKTYTAHSILPIG
jgi:transposase-like protein